MTSAHLGADSDLVRRAKRQSSPPTVFEWTSRDSILYNLGVGASADDLPYVFEGSPDFKVWCFFTNFAAQACTRCCRRTELLYSSSTPSEYPVSKHLGQD
jgi:hypothetical protein